MTTWTLPFVSWQDDPDDGAVALDPHAATSTATPAATHNRRYRHIDAAILCGSRRGAAFLVTGAVFLLALVAWIWIPDTSNAELM